MATLIFDIETVGEDFDALDHTTQDMLTRWIKKESVDDASYITALDEIKNGMGFSPLTGQVVAIGVLDGDRSSGAVYFQSPDTAVAEFEEEGIKYKPGTEAEILTAFWNLASHATEFVSFNGRAFDVPFLMIRSAIHQIRPSKDLMSNRYASSQKFGATHIDLADQLSFYGAVRRKGSLHLYCRAFGITSPKVAGVTGDDVAALFAARHYTDIARYNARDLWATRALYTYWKQYLRF
jgi:DNA polymerase elongation subunit (family B)